MTEIKDRAFTNGVLEAPLPGVCILERAHYRESTDTMTPRGTMCPNKDITDGLFKVSSTSNPNSVAGAIASCVREQKAHQMKTKIEIRVIGAGSINQAMKAVIIARGFLAPIGIELAVVPSFEDLTMGSDEITSVKLILVELDR